MTSKTQNSVNIKKLYYKESDLLKIVSIKLNIQRLDKEAPKVHFSSLTPLSYFQDMVQPLWKIRPEKFVNVYIPQQNLIFLNDESFLYQNGRTIDDSLVHELTHYFQIQYFGYTAETEDAIVEGEAVETQTWFREEFMKPPLFSLTNCFKPRASVGLKENDRESGRENFLYQEDFDWGMTSEIMQQKYEEIYQSGKRLSQRFYYDNKSKLFISPYSSGLSKEEELIVSPRFISSIAIQINNALKSKVAEFIFFPDMGHAHFFIPNILWKTIYDRIETKNFNFLYQKLFFDRQILSLYHLAEQLKFKNNDGTFIQDSGLQDRYQKRNIIADAKGNFEIAVVKNKNKFNTVNELEDHYYFSSAFNISASKGACFEFTKDNQKYFFDISLRDLPPKLTD